jgi:signal recognition particle subunit SRP54
MASRILGMGDVMSLIEKAEQSFDAEEAAKTAAKLQKKGGKDFTLDDFLAQMQSVRKMGPLTKIFGMLPGAAQFKDQLENFDEREIDRIEAVIHSMTPTERNDPNIINGSRRARIAKGSGTEVATVSGLVERFFEARKMMSAMASGKGMPGLPGMPGMPGMGGGKRAKQQAKKGKAKRGSGNPAKRANQGSGEPAAPEPGQLPAAFGGGAGAGADGFELPDELKNLLGPK